MQPQFEALGAVLLGISGDDPKTQAKFAEKHGLKFPLLCDEDHRVAEAYGAWVEKVNYGKRSMGIQRSTFVIAPDGTLARVFPKVSIEGHAEEVRDAVRAIQR